MKQDLAHQRVIIKEIARLSGSSITAVSLILNRHPHRYAQGTVERVNRTAAKYGYKPSASARSMRRGRFMTATVVMSSRLDEGYFPDFMRLHFHNELEKRDMHMGVAMLDDALLEDESYVPQILEEWRSDGLFLSYNSGPPDGLLRLLDKYRIPFVCINSRQAFDCVYPNDEEAGRSATHHLAELGHERIAFVTGPGTGRQHYSEIDRIKGYRSVMEELGLQPDIYRLEVELASNRIRHFRGLFGRDPAARPTACLSSGALAMLNAALANGLKAPSDVSLMYFGNERFDELGLKATRMNIPWRVIAKMAVDVLMQKIESPALRMPALTVGTELIEGETVTPPNNA